MKKSSSEPSGKRRSAAEIDIPLFGFQQVSCRHESTENRSSSNTSVELSAFDLARKHPWETWPALLERDQTQPNPTSLPRGRGSS